MQIKRKSTAVWSGTGKDGKPYNTKYSFKRNPIWF
jgi:hypothetical protein